MSPEWIWLIFVFMFGSCVGSFLNVVIYRLPRDKSLVYPASACPACGRRIRFYDNIPLVSWLVLCGRCRDCKTRISPRYFVIELVTAMLFTGIFYWFFIAEYRQTGIEAHTGLDKFLAGGWLFYIVAILLVSAFLAASAIDLELWVIPLSLCWFVTAAGLVAASAGVFVINPAVIWSYRLFPHASAGTGALAAGAAVGLILSLTGVWTGIIKRSYESEDDNENGTQIGPCDDNAEHTSVNDRAEIIKEIVFVLPIIVCAAAALLVSDHTPVVQKWWAELSQKPAVSGFFGSLWGYFVGGAVVWATRILGTLAFGREAMGLGDVHLMAAAGTVIGPLFVVIAFFVAPFFGLAWAGYQVFFKRTRQIPYGPFLSTAVFVVMIFHDRIWTHVSSLYMMN